MDLVFFRAAVLELHFSLPFEGERYVLVFANSKPLFECLKQQLDNVPFDICIPTKLDRLFLDSFVEVLDLEASKLPIIV